MNSVKIAILCSFCCCSNKKFFIRITGNQDFSTRIPYFCKSVRIAIAKASGKLGFFLKHAKPVLASNFPSLSQLVEKYQFGIVINDPSDAQEIKVAIEKILGSYDMYSNNSKSCFEAEFDFEKKFAPILSYMNSFHDLEFTRS